MFHHVTNCSGHKRHTKGRLQCEYRDLCQLDLKSPRRHSFGLSVRACPGKLSWAGRANLNVSSTTPWAGVPDWTKSTNWEQTPSTSPLPLPFFLPFFVFFLFCFLKLGFSVSMAILEWVDSLHHEEEYWREYYKILEGPWAKCYWEHTAEIIPRRSSSHRQAGWCRPPSPGTQEVRLKDRKLKAFSGYKES